MQRITVDIGGTFTDVAGFDEESGELPLGKSSGTPQNLVDGIFAGITEAGSLLPDTTLLIHGSTVVALSCMDAPGIAREKLT